MPIEYRHGDIFQDEDKLTIIAHQCNCQGRFGSGFAKVIKERYPMANEYQFDLYHNGGQKLGVLQLVSVKKNLQIANMFAQEYYGYDGKKYTSYDALDICFKKLKRKMDDTDVLGMPKVGADRGGGDWRVIESIINSVFDDRTVYVYLL